jgi:hypothetical protein
VDTFQIILAPESRFPLPKLLRCSPRLFLKQTGKHKEWKRCRLRRTTGHERSLNYEKVRFRGRELIQLTQKQPLNEDLKLGIGGIMSTHARTMLCRGFNTATDRLRFRNMAWW